MKIEAFRIQNYRSIEDVTLSFPKNKPLILFGPNNAGKSNLLSALDIFLGERYPTYREMKDNDFFMRNPQKYPEAILTASFDATYYHKSREEITTVELHLNKGEAKDAKYFCDTSGNKLYISQEDRRKCQSFMIDAVRNLFSEFNYASSYSLLSKFSRRVHDSLGDESRNKLSLIFRDIKEVFSESKEFKQFFDVFQNSVKNSVSGFVHSLGVDFSAYDPTNYAKSMRIYAKEQDQIRGFDEFGTGEQQILLMAFVKAYMETFGAESFVLIIEEPEAHLHPLAQKWLKEYVDELCQSGIQVVISTHSSDFLDFRNLDGLVRVYKAGGMTLTSQISPYKLCQFCIETGVDKRLVNEKNICEYFSTRLTSDQLRGLFADVVLLVEGQTELHALPVLFKRIGYYLPKEGIEIVSSGGKNNIPLLWRIYKAYGYMTYLLFDADCDSKVNDNLFSEVIKECKADTNYKENWMLDPSHFTVHMDFAYFGKDFENYLRENLDEYEELQKVAKEEHLIKSKPGIARYIASNSCEIPEFILQLKNHLEFLKLF